MCTNVDGKSAQTSSSTASKNANVASLPAQKISFVTPGPWKNG